MSSSSPLHHERVIAVEALSALEREQAQRLFEWGFPKRSGLVLVGAMRGWASWDIRPLVLEPASGGGVLWIVRRSDPALGQEPQRLNRLKDLVRFSGDLDSAPGVLWGIEAEQLWVRRKFFPFTLGSINRPAIEPSIETLVRQVSEMHARGFAHGHICPANIGIGAAGAVLLDAGLCAYSPTIHGVVPELAPECRQHGEVSVRSDLYGLGLVIQELFGAHITSEQAVVVQALLRTDPQDRPSLEAIEKSFGLQLAPVRRIAAAVGSDLVRSGRVIEAAAIVPAPSSTSQKTPVVHGQSTLRQGDGAATVSEAAVQGELRTMSEQRWTMLLLLGAAVFIAVGMWWFQPDHEAEVFRLKKAWESGQQDLMQEVVRGAVYGAVPAAQDVIISSALEGRTRPPLRANLLRIAFNPLWAKELSAGDRQVALTFGLAGFIKNPPRSLPPLSKTHPGVILAVVGDLGLRSGEGQFREIPVSTLKQLPAPYGLAFSELAKLKVESVGDPEARALSHIVSGDASPEVLDAFLKTHSQSPDVVSKLLIILPFTELYRSLADNLFSGISKHGEVFSKRKDWFSSSTVVNWSAISTKDKLFFCLGLFPDTEIAAEYLADLLRFPSATIRSAAVSRLSARNEAAGSSSLGGLNPSWQYLSEETHRFSREQLVALVLALRSSGESIYQRVTRWFQTNPDTDSVLGLLLARKGQESKLDVWNVEAARYLANHEFRASTEQLRALASHTEPLARALAYSHLDPLVPSEADILREAAQRETSPKIRSELLRKLELALQQ